MSFFTRKGDDGTTGWLGKGRIAKDDARIETVGTLDEASAALGVARASARDPRSAALVLEAQRDLYRLMAEVASPPENAGEFHFDAGRVTWLEQQIERLGRGVEMPAEFIVPGDSPAEAAFALARTVVRRAERRVVGLSDHKLIQNPALQEYLNRLSSLLFVLELIENRAAGKGSTPARK
jgi:cob(I)alamin adenosyltransferase